MPKLSLRNVGIRNLLSKISKLNQKLGSHEELVDELFNACSVGSRISCFGSVGFSIG